MNGRVINVRNVRLCALCGKMWVITICILADEAPAVRHGFVATQGRGDVRINEYHIAVIPGDGIGQEVTPEGGKALETARWRHRPRCWEGFD